MIDLEDCQRRIFENKAKHGFNTTDVKEEFINIVKELAEAINAYEQQLDDIGEELADIIIFVIGIAAILHINIESELMKKVSIIEQREYSLQNGRFFKK